MYEGRKALVLAESKNGTKSIGLRGNVVSASITSKRVNLNSPAKPLIHVFLNGSAAAVHIEAIGADIGEEIRVAATELPLRSFLSGGRKTEQQENCGDQPGYTSHWIVSLENCWSISRGSTFTPTAHTESPRMKTWRRFFTSPANSPVRNATWCLRLQSQ